MSTAPKAAIDDSPRGAIARVLTAAGLPADIATGYADLVCAEFAGEDVYFAVRQWGNLSERDDQIRAAAAAGRSLRALAREYCLSKSRVQQLVADGRCGVVHE